MMHRPSSVLDAVLLNDKHSERPGTTKRKKKSLLPFNVSLFKIVVPLS
jgi:hypothetical protein